MENLMTIKERVWLISKLKITVNRRKTANRNKTRKIYFQGHKVTVLTEQLPLTTSP